jgi:hypothetical protein
MTQQSTEQLLDQLLSLNLDILYGDDSEETHYALMDAKGELVDLLKTKTDNIDTVVEMTDRRIGALKGEYEVMQEELKRMSKRIKAAEIHKRYLGETLLPAIIYAIGTEDGRLVTKRAKYKMYETFGPVVIDELFLNDEYYKTTTTKMVDKKKAREAAKAAWNEKTTIPGALITKVTRVKRS